MVKIATWEDPSTRCRSLGMTCRYVVPFNRTGYIRNVAGGRLPPLRTQRLVIPFNRTGSIRGVSGTAHRPFPTVSLVGVFFNQRISKAGTSVTNNCQLTTVNLEQKSTRRPRVLFDGDFYFLAFLFWRRCSLVGSRSSTVGISSRQMKAAVRPPLYRQ